MAAGIQYTIKKNRYEKSLSKGITLTENGFVCDENEGVHYLILKGLDSGTEDCNWGRLAFNEDLEDEVVYYLHVFAVNDKNIYTREGIFAIDDFLQDEEVSPTDKKRFFVDKGCTRVSNKSDFLLYEQKGRYLYIMIEIMGETTHGISNMKVYAPGDNFMRTFPSVYQNYGDFFHRYISVFSSMYNDLQEKIDNTHKLLDLDTANKELLMEYGSWMGLQLEGEFLSVEVLRGLVKEAYNLNKFKGTRSCIEKICEIILGKVPLIVEQNKIQNGEDNNMYGKSPYDVSLLIADYVDERTKSQLVYLLEQFKPIRSHLRIVFLQDSGVLDEYSYLDMNAKVFEKKTASLDDAVSLNGQIIIK